MSKDNTKRDTSWKKLVIAKTNDEWMTTVKTENTDKYDEEKHDNDSDYEECDALPLPIVQMDCGSSGDELPISNHKRRRKKEKSPKPENIKERETRLARMSAYAAQRLANETPEKRAARLKRMSEYAARRLATETQEQREKRLARMSAYAAKRLAEESPEQRSARLSRMSAYAHRRQAMKKISTEKQDMNQSDYSTNCGLPMFNTFDNQS